MSRPHPIPFAHVGEIIRLTGKRKAVVLEVAGGIGWPCYRIDKGQWIGHWDIKGVEA